MSDPKLEALALLMRDSICEIHVTARVEEGKPRNIPKFREEPNPVLGSLLIWQGRQLHIHPADWRELTKAFETASYEMCLQDSIDTEPKRFFAGIPIYIH